MKYLLLLAVLPLYAQLARTRFDVRPYPNDTVGEFRLYESRANGTNYSGFQARSLMASNCLYEVSVLGIYPCADAVQTLGDPAKRLSHVYSAAATISGSGTALTLSGSSSGSAIDITGTGGGRAYSWYGTQRVLAGGTGFYVTPDGVSQNVVIDASRNGTFNNVTVSGTCTGCGSLPVSDSTIFAQDNSDATKQMRFELSSIGSGTTTVLTVPSNPGPLTLAARNIDNNFSVGQTVTTLTSSGTNYNEFSVPSGGMAAATFTATSSLNSTGTIALGSSLFTLAQFVDNARNVTFNTAKPITNFSGSIGDSSTRVDLYFGRFVNLQSSGSAASGMRASDSSGNLKFTMGEVFGHGEMQIYNSGGTEYFGAVAGNVRYNGNTGQTTSVVIGGCTMNFTQGGLTSKSGC